MFKFVYFLYFDLRVIVYYGGYLVFVNEVIGYFDLYGSFKMK